MSDKVEKTVAWLRSKIAEAAPPDDLDDAEIGVNVATLAEALQGLRAGGGMLFGMNIPGEVFATAGADLTQQAERELTRWKQRLAEDFGDEGTDAFREITLRYGLALDPLPALGRDPDVSRALARLFAALDDVDAATRAARAANKWLYDDDHRMAYHVVRESDPLGFAQLASELDEVPPQLEGLFAELDELVLGGSATGGRSDVRVDDYSLIEPVANAEVVDLDDEPCVILHRQEMGAILYVRVSDGAVFEWITKFEDAPKQLAPSLAEYFDQLATSLSAS